MELSRKLTLHEVFPSYMFLLVVYDWCFLTVLLERHINDIANSLWNIHPFLYSR